MGSSIILKLLNVTQYYRNNNARKWYAPYGYDADNIELNHIQLHIYQGESLGIIGESDSSKSLIGRLLAEEIKPDKGRVVRKRDIFFADIDDKVYQRDTVYDYINNVVSLFPRSDNPAEIVQSVIDQAQLSDDTETPVQRLTDEQYAQLSFVLAQLSEASIIIFNHIIQYLSDTQFEAMIPFAKQYIENNQTLVFIDDDVDRIEQVSNYIAWISHGQLRMEGQLKEVLPMFREHEKDRLSIQTEEDEANFDLDWKQSRNRIPELANNFKRVERYQHQKPPAILYRFWGLLLVFVLGAILMLVLIFNNVGRLDIAQNIDQNKIQDQQQNPFEETLAYGIALNKEKLQRIGSDQTLSSKKYALYTITGENTKNYRVQVDGKDYKIAKNNVRYFDPAGLYEKHQMQTLAPYMKNNYINFVDYFNSQLHKSHNEVTDTLVPENDKDQRFVVPITQQPIDMLFNDKNNLAGFVYPMTKKDELKKKYDINSNSWMVKTDSGYLMADMKNKKWIYIEL
ncbi:ATP-binding cassette domain-containing protein [Staphylococcus auricularis]|uniref:ATP-binding cassette domain-containing protein n=1 Tax=Staphylococcus auricularis TaxID=29379 RepID=UPI000D1A1F0D|nr:ATP-binding cassette domain-containing protein [Staphylococcus auricularis]PTH26158.1 teichoic acid ABC transporter ATP-binding protein [Staphylococcus auricularis]